MADLPPSPPRAASSRAGVIFDRDGVLNVDHGYVHRQDQLEWTPGARHAVARLNKAGVAVVVATNQSGVARGYYGLDDLDEFHEHMQLLLAEVGGHIDRFYAAPHHEDATVEAFRHPDHPDRKPNPGMLLAAIADFGLDPAYTLMVGDRASDLEAARRAGVRGVLYEGGDLEAFVAAALAEIGVIV